MIKNGLINFLRFISPIFSVKKIITRSNQVIFLPFYHCISNTNHEYIKNLYPVRNEKIFINDLDFFTHYFKPVDLDFLLNNKTVKEPVFHLSFDDGLSDVYNVIAPILLKKGIPASFFVNTDFIDNKDLFFRYKASIIIEKFKNYTKKELLIKKINKNISLHLSVNNFNTIIKSIDYNNKHILDKIAVLIDIDFNEYLQTNKPYLTTKQINELIKKGFTIGSHSMSHPEYRTIKYIDQIKQTTESMKFITDNFKPKHKIFSFPFTDYNVSLDFFNYIYKNNIVDYSFATAGLKIDNLNKNFQRFAMDGTLIPADKLVKAEYLYFLFKKIFNKNVIYH